RVLWHLRPRPPTADDGAEKLVLAAHEASVMDLFSVDLDRLAGVVVEHGGPHSHAAILARSLGIPMVGQVPELLGRLQPGRSLKVDGTNGLICLDPGPQCSSVGDTPTARSRTRESPAAEVSRLRLREAAAQPSPAAVPDTALQNWPRI